MKKQAPILLAALLACSMICPAFAAEPAHPATPAALYPSEVVETVEGDTHHLQKVYLLTLADDPAFIPTEDFDREGFHYTLLDVTREDYTESDSKDYSETVTLESDTDDMNKIMPQLTATKEVLTEDGYIGVLTLDTASIQVEAAGYKSTSRTVSASRTYPNLSDADTSYIPKSITDGGRTLTLADIQWQESEGFYTASATYTGTATAKFATGYVVTANYAGEVVKTISGTMIYTATFSGMPIEKKLEPVPVVSQTVPAQEPEQNTSANSSFMWLLVFPVGGGAVGLYFLGRYLLKKYKSGKAWKEYTK